MRKGGSSGGTRGLQLYLGGRKKCEKKWGVPLRLRCSALLVGNFEEEPPAEMAY